MKKSDKKLSSEEVKKQQDKIILITRIVGVTLFLVGISIIFITAVIRGRQSEEPKEDIVIFESVGENFTMYLEDEKILEEDYIVLKSIEDYNSFVSVLDTWTEESYNNYVEFINNNEFIDEEKKTREIDNYKVMNDQRYKDIKKIMSEANITSEKFNDKVFIVVEDITSNMILNSHILEDICLDNNKLTLYFSKDSYGVVADKYTSLHFIELDKKYADMDISVNVSRTNSSDPTVDYKPVIYIYPEKEMDVKVKLESEDKIIVSYPEYNNYWDVRALGDGTLIDKKTNRELYSLYYESLNKVNFNVMDDGFVVSEEEIIPFLENKLEILGLNSRESEEFIIYWLPILKKNKYNYIRFATIEEIDENMGLSIEPKPDSVIRILMTFKGLDEKINVKEQVLTPVKRKGYSVIEWGGTIIE